MASSLFDPMLELALSVAKKAKKSKSAAAIPVRLEPMVRFAKLPDKAKDAVLDVLDTDDEFRARVAKAATEASIGRVGVAYLERTDGWEKFVNQMLTAADEPIVESTTSSKKLVHRLEVSERARERAEEERDELGKRVDVAEKRVSELDQQASQLQRERDELAASQSELTEQRQRAVAELKKTESVMARHISERKRLEGLLETMTTAQLSTTAVGGTLNNEQVRDAVGAIEALIADASAQLDSLRSAATPEQVVVERRVPLRVPHGLLDDSVEYAEYLLAIPNMTVLVDGYNVTKLAHYDQPLEQQRSWLEQQLCGLLGSVTASFDVVFDGADVDVDSRSLDPRVRVRFSPDGVEADDVIIDSVSAMDRARPVTVISSDKRVRAGVTERGANVLHSAQLVALLA